MKVLVFLGNPGPEYIWTRHNAGFLVGEAYCQAIGMDNPDKKHKALVFKKQAGTDTILALFPQTFMNLSGDSVQSVLSFYKLDKKDMLVVYDDFDIPFGEVRFREKGSAGTHNGMRDIVLKLASTDFSRVKIGIGPKPANRDTADFVLSNFSKVEKESLSDIFQKAIQIIQEWSSKA